MRAGCSCERATHLAICGRLAISTTNTYAVALVCKRLMLGCPTDQHLVVIIVIERQDGFVALLHASCCLLSSLGQLG